MFSYFLEANVFVALLYQGVWLISYIELRLIKLTIGYGHVIRESEKTKYAEISPAEARELLLKDIDTARYAIYNLTRVPLSMEQEAALISFVFNCGSGAYQASTLRQKLNRGEYLWAADEIPSCASIVFFI